MLHIFALHFTHHFVSICFSPLTFMTRTHRCQRSCRRRTASHRRTRITWRGRVALPSTPSKQFSHAATVYLYAYAYVCEYENEHVHVHRMRSFRATEHAIEAILSRSNCMRVCFSLASVYISLYMCVSQRHCLRKCLTEHAIKAILSWSNGWCFVQG